MNITKQGGTQFDPTTSSVVGMMMQISRAMVDTAFVDIYVDTKHFPTCRYNIQYTDRRTMEK